MFVFAVKPIKRKQIVKVETPVAQMTGVNTPPETDDSLEVFLRFFFSEHNISIPDPQALARELGIRCPNSRADFLECFSSLNTGNSTIDQMFDQIFGTNAYLHDGVPRGVVLGNQPVLPLSPSLDGAKCLSRQELGSELELSSSRSNLTPPHEEVTAVCLAPGKSRRGENLRSRTEKSALARDDWAARVAALRAECEARRWRLPESTTDLFEQQIRAAHRSVKAQKECILRFLQLAADDGLLVPALDQHAPSFFGWVGFTAAPGRAHELRAAAEELFGGETTLERAFLRAGLEPEGFHRRRGWDWAVAFRFREAPGAKRRPGARAVGAA